jgi:two-component sensor histidine kinase
MGLVHEKLYRSRDLTKIDVGGYLQNPTTNLFTSYQSKSDGIALKIDVKDVFLGVDRAIPCGLIINELVSNALKYAFLRGKKGEIGISLKPDRDRHLTLKVWDSGVRFPKGLDFRKTETLGLQLVSTLTTQLEGKIELYRQGGTEFRIILRIKE